MLEGGDVRVFTDRRDAGRRLGTLLGHRRGEPVVILGLPRGGIPVAFEVARSLGAPLDAILVRKLGVPYQPELAMGAIGENGVRILNGAVLARAGVAPAELEAVEAHERQELERRAVLYRGDRQPVPVSGHTAVVVDDGLATGSTARVACQVAREIGASLVVLAVPVAPLDWTSRLGPAADEYVAVTTPRHMFAIGESYRDFSETSDDEVISLLRASTG